MKFSLAVLLDTIFSAFVTFIICFILLNYFLSRLIAITISACLCALFALLVFKYLSNNRAKIKLSATDRKNKKIMTASLNLYTQTEQNDLFERAIKKHDLKVERKKGALLIKDQKIAVFPLFKFDGVSKTDIVKIFNSVNSDYLIYIFSENFSPEIKQFADRFDGRINTVNQDETYIFLSELNLLPKQKINLNDDKKLNLSAFKNLIKKSRAKSHFLFGIIFLLSSYFSPFKLYYIIFGCTFLFLSLFCTLFGKNNAVHA